MANLDDQKLIRESIEIYLNSTTLFLTFNCDSVRLEAVFEPSFIVKLLKILKN